MNPYAIILFYPLAYIWYLIMQSKYKDLKTHITIVLATIVLLLVTLYQDILLLPILSAIPLWFFIAKWICDKLVDIS